MTKKKKNNNKNDETKRERGKKETGNVIKTDEKTIVFIIWHTFEINSPFYAHIVIIFLLQIRMRVQPQPFIFVFVCSLLIPLFNFSFFLL